MTIKMTKRDRKLLFFLLIFSIITLGGHFLIAKPLQKQATLKERYEALETQKLELNYRLSQRQNHLETIKDLRGIVKGYEGRLTIELSKEQVDNLLSTAIVTNQMKPTTLNLGSISTNGDEMVGVRSIPIEINVNGTLESARSLLTVLQQLPYSKVESFSFASGERASHRFQLILYMMSQDLVGEASDE
ncbi:MAG: hypothetical protein ACRDDX_13755 [Cellulosilyticaceae bacterium]